MFKLKFIISFIIFSSLLVYTSVIKNQTRDLEKNIINISKIIHKKEKDFYESQLDFSYLTSPIIIEKKIEHLDNIEYLPMEFSKIFLGMSDFQNLYKKIVLQEQTNEKKTEKK